MSFESGRSGEVAGQEGEKLARVALVGLERVVRQATLVGERRKPRRAFVEQRLVGDDEQLIHARILRPPG